MNSKVIKIKHDKCLSCYRCISVCPVKYCNDVSGDSILVHNELCIHCGKCVEACSHKARSESDDLHEVMNLLDDGQKCAVLFDSPINASFYNNMGSLYESFKTAGVTDIIESGFGHELCAKSYADYINKSDTHNLIITTTCPVIVNYIEIYKPELIKYLAPVDSPIAHSIKVIRAKYNDLDNHKLVYFSPCIAKKNEFTRLFNNGIYNMTYKAYYSHISGKNLLADFNQPKVNIDPEKEYDKDLVVTGSRLSENIKKYAGDDIEIRKVTGIHDVVRYLDSIDVYSLDLGKKVLLDLLSCKSGCEGGSGTTVSGENPDKLAVYSLKYRDLVKESGIPIISTGELIQKYYDFIKTERKFHDRSNHNWVETPGQKEVENIYVSMYKNSNNDVKNCSSCGYHKCEKMAVAVYNNLNKIENCHFYLYQKLSYLAFHDSVTGLLNRTAFRAKLEESINLEMKFNIINERVIVLFDIYGFREINETLGNDVGDEVLVRTASRIRSSLSDDDLLFRIGSDEFAIIINGARTQTEMDIYIHEILTLFSSSMFIDDNELFINMNCGGAYYPIDGDTASAVIKNAETALHEAKFLKKEFVAFTMDMHIRAIERLTIINNMRSAIEREEFILYYQPQYSFDGKLTGAEALIRWIKPEIGVIAPDKFIPLAEESGLIIPIGEWVIDRVCRDFVKLREAGIDITLSANLSVRQFRDKELLTKIEGMLKKYDIEKHKIHLEITESFIMDNSKESLAKIKKLSDMGLKISLDDFGTGYSCLSYLNHLALDTLKIDKSFIDQITDEGNTNPLVDTIVSMAMGMGLDVVAEGVSDIRHVEYLKKFEYNIIMQGFYFSRPLPFDSFFEVALEAV